MCFCFLLFHRRWICTRRCIYAKLLICIIFSYYAFLPLCQEFLKSLGFSEQDFKIMTMMSRSGSERKISKILFNVRLSSPLAHLVVPLANACTQLCRTSCTSHPRLPTHTFFHNHTTAGRCVASERTWRLHLKPEQQVKRVLLRQHQPQQQIPQQQQQQQKRQQQRQQQQQHQ